MGALGTPPYDVWGLRGHIRRSNTQTESRPSFSASFPIYRTFSLVADSPVCGKTIPTFITNTKEIVSQRIKRVSKTVLRILEVVC
jgi:hypothetical protein